MFFSSVNSVKYHAELLNYIDVNVLSLHGKQKQAKRSKTFFEFRNAERGFDRLLPFLCLVDDSLTIHYGRILLCTDVAARGLDIPSVDWIIQFDPPDDPKEYIHRCDGAHDVKYRFVCLLVHRNSVGRTARGKGKKGRALLFLLPSELRFLKYLKEMKVPLEEYEFPNSKIANVQSQVSSPVPPLRLGVDLSPI